MDGFAYGIPKFATVLGGRTLCDPRLLDATTGMRLAATRCEVMGVGIPLPRLPKLKETFGVIRFTLAALAVLAAAVRDERCEGPRGGAGVDLECGRASAEARRDALKNAIVAEFGTEVALAPQYQDLQAIVNA